MSRFNAAWGLLGLACLPLGCYATAGAYADADYVEVRSAPAHVELYPSYEYRGRTVYLVDGHWYYRHGPHWVYYREEPEELHRHRGYVERAPRAPDRDERRHYRPTRPAEDRD